MPKACVEMEGCCRRRVWLLTAIFPSIMATSLVVNGQSQARAAVAPRGRLVRLLEGLEDGRELVRRDADPVSRTEK